MNLSLLSAAFIQVYGDTTYRNRQCPLEDAELITFIEWVKREYPMFPVIHVKNERKRKGKGFAELRNERKKGALVKGWADITIAGFPTLFIEMKRQDHTLCELEDEQLPFLVKAQAVDCWCVVALGWQAARDAFMDWLKENYPNMVKKTCNHKSAEVISISPKPR